MRSLLILILLFFGNTAAAVELTGKAVQGGLIFGKAEPGSVITLDDTSISVSEDGHFVIGFGRDESGTRELQVTSLFGLQQMHSHHIMLCQKIIQYLLKVVGVEQQ